MGKIETTSFNGLSRLSFGTRFKGELYSSSDIRIDGEFEGRIATSGKVVIGDTSVVKGDIVAGSADIWGKVEGNIYVGETLSLKDGSSFKGNVQVLRFNVEMGASFDGNCKMISSEDFQKILKSDSGMQQTAKIQENKEGRK